MLGTPSKRDSLSADFRLKECLESKLSVVRRAPERETLSVAVVGRSWFAAVGMAVALGGAPAEAQDLTAGRTPAQLFASGCTACHKSPQGLAKGQSGGALSGFLRQHYTSKPEMADALAGYLAASGNAPAPAGRAGRAAAQEPPGAPGAAQPPGRARATIAVPAAGVPADAGVEQRSPHTAKRQPPATAARPGAKPDAPESGASPAAAARGGAPSITTEERGRAGAGQVEAGRTPPGSRRHRDTGASPDAPGHADRVTNLHGAAAPSVPAPTAPASSAPASTPAEPTPPTPSAEPNAANPDANTSVANAPPAETSPVSAPSEPPKPSMDMPTASTTPPASPVPTASTPPAAAPAESSPKATGSFSRKPNVDKDATAVAEEKSAVRSGPPVRMRPNQQRGAAAGNAATARRPSPDSPN